MIARHLALAVVIAAASGCVSAYSQGPRFTPVTPPAELGVVHVYRPHKNWGAATFIDVFLYGRHVSLCSGSYATMVVPPGKHKVDVAILAFTQIVMMNGFGFTGAAVSAEEANARAPVEVEVGPGQTVYVKVEFTSRGDPPSSEVVPTEDGLDDIEDLYLIPGGRARWPVFMPEP